MAKTIELREKRAKLISDANDLITRATSENRNFTADDEAQYSRIMADVDGLMQTIERIEHLDGLQSELRGSTGTVVGSRANGAQTADANADNFRHYIQTGEVRGSGWNITTAAEGGYFVPDVYLPTMLRIPVQLVQ